MFSAFYDLKKKNFFKTTDNDHEKALADLS